MTSDADASVYVVEEQNLQVLESNSKLFVHLV